MSNDRNVNLANYMTVAEASAALEVTKQTVYNRFYKNRWRTVKIGKIRLLHREDVLGVKLSTGPDLEVAELEY